jgi:hypothetical protein
MLILEWFLLWLSLGPSFPTEQGSQFVNTGHKTAWKSKVTYG